MKFSDIPQFPRACYSITVEWKSIESTISRFNEGSKGFTMDPEYQRDHVWTTEQQIAYVEYGLKGGESGRIIMSNCPGWQGPSEEGIHELVDGKQRVEAVRKFMRNDLKVFGGYRFDDIEGHIRTVQGRFDWRVFNLEKREDILKLYIDINAGGTPHTQEEIDKVRIMLEKEKS